MDEHIRDGRRALAAGRWQDARAAFARSLAAAPSVAAYEGLGVAARYLIDAEGATAAHREGYRLAREAGDPDAAARLAVQLGFDAYTFTGVAEAVGWIERAAMLIEGRPASAASAFVPCMRAYVAMLGEHDPARARAGCAVARRRAREVGEVDVELLAVAVDGLALVAEGRVAEGMARLDAATAAALGGEMTDADAIETVCCLMIDACKRVRDIDRAAEWCDRVRAIAGRFGDRIMFAVCRVHHADVLLWSGDLAAAEAELVAAVEELGRARPGRDADALVRLAEIRRRQGRPDEARALLGRAGGHPLSPLVEGAMALDRGEAAVAADDAARFLRRIGPADGFARVAGLELSVRAALARGDREGAGRAAEEIAVLAARPGAVGLRPADLVARARLAAHDGDPAAARAHLEDAADLLDRAGARYDAALVRRELAAALRAAGDAGRARGVDAAARDALRALGAYAGDRPAGALSAREEEVLRMVARGMSNEDIAGTLVLSVRTVERHVANVYAKIGASGRTARAAATAWAHAEGIA